jgi:hypothetical protein
MISEQGTKDHPIDLTGDYVIKTGTKANPIDLTADE